MEKQEINELRIKAGLIVEYIRLYSLVLPVNVQEWIIALTDLLDRDTNRVSEVRRILTHLEEFKDLLELKYVLLVNINIVVEEVASYGNPEHRVTLENIRSDIENAWFIENILEARDAYYDFEMAFKLFLGPV